MSDEVNVANLALALVGSASGKSFILESWDLTNDESRNDTLRACQTFLPRARSYCQQVLDWPECMRYGPLAAAPAVPIAMPGWTYIYTKPEGCLTLRAVVLTDTLDLAHGIEHALPYQVLGQQVGILVLSSEVYAKYLLEVTDATQWSEPLRELIAHRLALYLARALGPGLDVQAQMVKLYDLAWTEARQSLGREHYISQRPRPVYRHRDGYRNYQWPGFWSH